MASDSSRKTDSVPPDAPVLDRSPAGWRYPSFISPVASITLSARFLAFSFEINQSTTVTPTEPRANQRPKHGIQGMNMG